MGNEDKRRPDDESDAPPESGDAPQDASAAQGDDDVAVEGDDPAAPALDPAVVRRFLGSKAALDVAKAAIRPLVPAQEVDDLASDAVVRAMRAPPPRTQAALVSWLGEIARRTAIRWLEKRARREKHEGPMPRRAAQEDAYTGEAIGEELVGADALGASYDPEGDEEPLELIGSYLDRIVEARDREVLEAIGEKAAGRSYKDICDERGWTQAQLSNRLLRFKNKYGPRVRRRNRWMLALWLFAAVIFAAAIAVLWWLLGRDDIRSDPAHVPELRPVPSASASAAPEEPFTPALPTGDGGGGGDKPR